MNREYKKHLIKGAMIGMLIVAVNLLLNYRSREQRLKFRPNLISPNAMIQDSFASDVKVKMEREETLLPDPIQEIRCVREMKNF